MLGFLRDFFLRDKITYNDKRMYVLGDGMSFISMYDFAILLKREFDMDDLWMQKTYNKMLQTPKWEILLHQGNGNDVLLFKTKDRGMSVAVGNKASREFKDRMHELLYMV